MTFTIDCFVPVSIACNLVARLHTRIQTKKKILCLLNELLGKFVNCFISNAIDIQISPHMKDSIAIDCIRLQHMVVIDCIQPSWIFTKLGLSEFLGVSTAPAKNKANRSYRSRFLGPFLGFMWRKTHNMAAILTHFLYFSVIGSG